MAVISKDLGPVSAYAVAVANGFTGTEAEWEQYIANASTAAQSAAGSATAAANSASAAAQSATAAAASQVAAAGSETEAANYALVAGNHAMAAAASATAAETAETGAETAQAAAEAAQAAAEAVAESIPEDYTELTEEVGGLKRAVNNIVTIGTNKLNANKIELYKTFDNNGNVIDSEEAYGVSEPIDIGNNSTYVSAIYHNTQGVDSFVSGSGVRFVFYNREGYIRTSDSNGAAVSIPTGATYFRIRTTPTYASALNAIMIAFTESVVPFEPYEAKINEALIEDVTTKLEENEEAIESLYTEKNTVKVNYFNPDTVTMNKSIDSSGDEQTTSGNCISDRIKIPAGKTNAVISYTGANGQQSIPSTYSRIGAYYYSESGGKIGGYYGAHQIPANASYVILTLNTTYAANENRRRVMYEFAENISGFVPFTDITETEGKTEKNHFDWLAEIVNNAPQIKIIGDSITQGVGGTGFSQDGELIFDGGSESTTWYVNTNGYCWANEFKTHIEAISNATVKNWGCRGISCMDVIVLDMLPTLIENDDDIVILMLGTNDRTDTQVPTQNASLMYQMNLKAICNYIINRGKKLILISSIPATPAGDSESGVRFTSNEMNAVCSSIAEQIGCEYFNLYKEFVNWTLVKGVSYSTMFADNLHPNDKGYEVMFYLICKGLNIPLDFTFSFVK